MKILHTVEFYYPSVGGAQEVVRQISEKLVKQGHEVTVATTRLKERNIKTHNGVKIAEFDIHGNKVNGYRGTDKEKYQKFLLDSDFDVIMNYAAQQWATDLFFEVMDRVKGIKVLVPCGFSGLHLPEYKKYFEHMPHILRKYDATIYNSNDYRDINFAREHKINNTHLIPNGADADEFLRSSSTNIRKQLKIPEGYFIILSVGSHTGLKGHKELLEIFKQSILRRSALVIVANDFAGGCSAWCNRQLSRWRISIDRLLKQKLLIIRQLPRHDTVDAYKEADLFLFPSNIEASPLVLFESIAAKTPFLVTDVGNSKEIIDWTKGGMLLPTIKDRRGFSHAKIDDSVKVLNHLYTNPDKLNRLAEAGFKNWRERYSWEVISGQYEKLYKELAKK